MHRDVMSSWLNFHLLSVGSSVCLLSSDWQFCGLAFPCLSTTKVLPPHQHPGQLLRSHFKPVTSFFGRPLIEILVVQLQPHRCCKYTGGAILRFMGQARCIWYGQNRLMNLLPSFLFCRLWPSVFNRVQKAFGDVNLHQGSESTIYDGVESGLVCDLGQCADVCAD